MIKHNGFTPYEASIQQIKNAFEENTLTSETLVSYYLKRIKVYDKITRSMISLEPKALEIARQMDKERAEGKLRGPLHGIPVVIKDNCEAIGMPTTCGCKSLAGFYAKRDAFAVKRLKDAGAIILGKSALSEFAVGGMGCGSLNKQSLNPYDLTRTPGGSSSGSGSAVSLNFAAGAVGTDTVNSLRSPASACSIVAIRATRGLISRTGIFPHTLSQDCAGPMAKYVADAALMLGVLAGCDPEDAFSTEIMDKKPEDYTAYLNKDGLKGKRLGLLVNNIGEDTDVVNAVHSAVNEIKALGAEIIDINEACLCASELLEANMLQRYAAKEDTDAYIAQVQPDFPFRDLQALVDDNINGENMGKEAYARFVKTLESKVSKASPEYVAKITENASLRDMAVGIMDAHQLDGFIYPLQSILVVKAGDPRGQAARNGIIAAITGLPAVTVPVGYSAPQPTARQGVPVGLDFLARPFAEGKLIEMTYAYEQATHHRIPPESFSDLNFSCIDL